MTARNFDLPDGWQARLVGKPPRGQISVIALENAREGLSFSRTRFDRGKLLFLDRPTGFPSFDRPTLRTFAKRINDHYQETA